MGNMTNNKAKYWAGVLSPDCKIQVIGKKNKKLLLVNNIYLNI